MIPISEDELTEFLTDWIFDHPDKRAWIMRLREDVEPEMLRLARLMLAGPDAMRALESFTPSGSEFVGDVKRCKEFIRRRLDVEHELLIKRTKECNELRSALAAAEGRK